MLLRAGGRERRGIGIADEEAGRIGQPAGTCDVRRVEPGGEPAGEEGGEKPPAEEKRAAA